MYIKNTGSTGYKAGAYALAVKRLRQTFRKPSKVRLNGCMSHETAASVNGADLPSLQPGVE